MVDFGTDGELLLLPGILPSPMPSGLFQELSPIKGTLLGGTSCNILINIYIYIFLCHYTL
jgi:hypothetical protein